VSAAAWLVFAKVVGQGFQFAVTIMLARLLVPKDYGLVAMAALMIEFLRYFNELGVGASIIQKKDLSEHQVSSVFWFALLLSLGIYALAYAGAPFAETFFHTPGLRRVFRVLALTFVIAGLKTVPAAMAMRDVEFKGVSIAEAASFFVSGTTSMALAWHGFGVWALVAGALAYDAAYSLILFALHPWRPRLALDFHEVRGMLRFGVTITSTRLLFNIYQEADNFVVSRVMGAVSLGFYSMAFRLARLPVEKISAVVNNIAFPVFSRVQDDQERLRDYYLKVARLISLLTFPLMVGGIVLADDLVRAVLTEKWAPSILAFQILSVSALFQSVYTINGHVLNARGRADQHLRYQVLAVISLPLAFYVGVHKGINGVALGWVLVEPVLMAYSFHLVFRHTDVRTRQYLGALAPAILSSAGMAAAVLLVRAALMRTPLAPTARVAVCVAVGAVAYLGLLLGLFRDTIDGLRSALRPRAA
jgi:O-antigen/teichoic acid export membrane protein